MFEIKVLSVITYIVRLYEWMDLFSFESEISLWRKVKRKFKFNLFLAFPVFVMLGSFQIEDRSESLYLVAVSICTSLHAIKFHYICTKMEIISILLNEFGVHTLQSRDTFISTEKTLKNFNYLSIVLLSVSKIMVILVYVFPFVFKKTLAVKIWFPLNWKENDFNFWMAYGYLAYCIFFCWLMVSFTVLIWFLMLNLAIKYRLLSYNLENLGWHPLDKEVPESANEKLFYEHFLTYTECYETLKCNLKQFSGCFHLLFLGQIITSGAGICTTVYSLSFDSTGNIVQYVINFYLLTYNIFDIFMIMYFGNEIKSGHGNLSNCVFNSNWLGQPMQVRKIQIIFMGMLAQTQELVIGKLYPLNLATFTSIMKGAYSMFNILQSLK